MRGRASIGDDPVGKMVCEKVLDIDDWPKELWVRFPDSLTFEQNSGRLLQLAAGKGVMVYLEKEKQKTKAPATVELPYEEDEIYRISTVFGEDNVRLADKSLEEIWKR